MASVDPVQSAAGVVARRHNGTNSQFFGIRAQEFDLIDGYGVDAGA